jgi:hypothetical protein
MNINQPIFAIIDPATGEVLGDGECLAVHAMMPNPAEIKRVRDHCSVSVAKVVECVLSTKVGEMQAEIDRMREIELAARAMIALPISGEDFTERDEANHLNACADLAVALNPENFLGWRREYKQGVKP